LILSSWSWAGPRRLITSTRYALAGSMVFEGGLLQPAGQAQQAANRKNPQGIDARRIAD
jgi:hypothetical protein